jgi:hypothetical protein
VSAEQISKDCSCGVLVTFRFSLVGIAQEFELNWLVVQRVLAKESDHLIEAISGWSIFMEQVTSKENKVNLVWPVSLANNDRHGRSKGDGFAHMRNGEDNPSKRS